MRYSQWRRRGSVKKGLVLLFCSVFVLSWQGEAHAGVYTNSETVNGVKYTYGYNNNTQSGKNSGLVIYQVDAPSTASVIKVPETLSKGTVVAIGASTNLNRSSDRSGKGAFQGNGKVTSVELPDTVREIYEDAFEGMTNLKKLSVNGDGIAIDYHAFNGCSNLSVTFRGTGKVKYVSGYAFEEGNSNHLDFNELKTRADKNSWIGYDSTWKNEAEWRNLVNSLTPVSLGINSGDDGWEPKFEVLKGSDYSDPNQIAENSYSSSEHKIWLRKAVRWLDSQQEKVEVRFDMAYNSMNGKTSNDMAMVLDLSGSMYFPYNLIEGSDYSRQFQTLNEARTMAKALLDMNENGTAYNRVAVSEFSDYLRGTTYGNSGTDHGFFTDYPELLKWFDANSTMYNGATNYATGLENAWKMISERSEKNRRATVLFLSDGLPNNGGQGKFPNGTSGYGGSAVSTIASAGIDRYAILLSDNSTAALDAIRLVAGKGGKNNDSAMTYKVQNSESLHAAFQEILNNIASKLFLGLEDEAGSKFSLNTGESVSTLGGNAGITASGQKTIWNLNGISQRETYTLVLTQNLKRDPSNNNAFYSGSLETNLGAAIILDSAMGTMVSVPSPTINKTLRTVNVRVHVVNGLAVKQDGSTGNEITETIPESGTYTARWDGGSNVLESLEVSVDGGVTRTPLNTILYPNSYTVENARSDYDIYAVYRIPYTPPLLGYWNLYATVENGTITPEEALGIPLRTTRAVKYSPDPDCALESITVDGVLLADPSAYANGYQFYEEKEGAVRTIHVVYKKPNPDETADVWGNYRN